jgi:drug/metabolite transporter (DMT)-like permease
MTPSVVVALVAVQVLFASLAIVGRFVLAEFPAGALIMLRVIGAGLLLALINAVRRGEWVRDRRDLLELAGLGFLGITLNQSLFVYGLSHTTAINATILVTMVPVFTVVGAVLLGREQASPAKLAGVALAFAGTIYLIGPDRLSLTPDVALGNALIAVGMACYAAYFLLARRMLARHEPLTVTTYVMLLSILTVAPVGLPVLMRLDVSAVRPAIWAGVAWIVVGPTLLAYLLNVWALRRVSSNTVAIYIYLQPIMTAAVAPLVLKGEALTARTVLAGIAIFIGVLVVLRAERLVGLAAPVVIDS